MTLILDLNHVEQAINVHSMIDLIEQGLVQERNGHVIMPPRLNMKTKEPGFFRIMPAVMNESGVMGYKVFFASFGTGVTRYMMALIDQSTMDMLALMDASYLTAVRTGATTGLATKYMARKDARSVGVIGSGLEARTNLTAIMAVRDIDYVKVFSPTPARRELYASEMSEKFGIKVEAVDSAAKAVEGVDIILVATNTSTKGGGGIAFEGKWMKPGVHVNSIGSTMPTIREIDEDSFANADSIVIDTRHIEGESGDIIEAIKQGKYTSDKSVELKDIVAGGREVRTSDEQITLFKSTGTAVQDLMAAQAVYEEAKKLGIGTEVDFLAAKLFK